MMRRILVVLAVAVLPAGCASPSSEERLGVRTLPLDAYCTITVEGVGTIDMEEDYLPHVVQCENGGADLESLKAQAVSARSYAYYKIETSGSVVDGTRDQVYSCGATPTALQLQAVRETAGQVLMYRDIVVCAFFVAGANPGDRGSCVAVAGDSDPTNTERYVTYNEGLSGSAVHQTTLGWVSPTNYRNRGCLSQWGSRCLDEAGTGYADILRFYYGADIVLETAVGACIGCTPAAETCNGADDDCDGATDEDGVCCTPATETCNGADDDCDGATDEDGVCCTPATETCNGVDDDCDGETDEGLGCCATAPETCNGVDDDCDGATDEDEVCETGDVAFQAGLLDDGGSTDVNGDGRADACARSAEGVVCYLASPAGFETMVAGPPLRDGDGWGLDPYGSTLRFGDIDGDGRDDVCARAADGLACWRSTGTGFGEVLGGPALADEVGWDAAGSFGTIRLIDVNGDGRDDACGRGPDGFSCWPSTGRGFGAPSPLADLSDAAGWGGAAYWGTIRMADVDGDGGADLCARAPEGVRCWRWRGPGFGDRIYGPAWSDSRGWDRIEYWSTIRMADVDGDGRADICGRAADGFGCHLSRGWAFGPAVAAPVLADAGGWAAAVRYETIRMGDIDGDGGAELCARDADGVSCWTWTAAGFGGEVTGPPLADEGWADPARGRTLRLADVTGDRRADLCVRGGDGLRCWVSGDEGFGELLEGPRWGDADGWDRPERTLSIRMAGPRRGTASRVAPGGCGCSTAERVARPGWTVLAGVLVATLFLRRGGRRRR
ncbi:MAG: VCBS repeat-containing protein [Deltaproteobacteria bacterium]|nr:VCBS repeat-containing protein [Deltaproteobacteria bacterium]